MVCPGPNTLVAVVTLRHPAVKVKLQKHPGRTLFWRSLVPYKDLGDSMRYFNKKLNYLSNGYFKKWEELQENLSRKVKNKGNTKGNRMIELIWISERLPWRQCKEWAETVKIKRLETVIKFTLSLNQWWWR